MRKYAREMIRSDGQAPSETERSTARDEEQSSNCVPRSGSSSNSFTRAEATSSVLCMISSTASSLSSISLRRFSADDGTEYMRTVTSGEPLGAKRLSEPALQKPAAEQSAGHVERVEQSALLLPALAGEHLEVLQRRRWQIHAPDQFSVVVNLMEPGPDARARSRAQSEDSRS